MQKYSASFLGRDCPGVVAVVSSLFGESRCNIEAMTQTTLCGEFAAIFVVIAPENLSLDDLRKNLVDGLAATKVDLSVMLRPAIGQAWGAGLELEPFVITIDGPDGPGIIGAMSRILGRHGVNIENLKAILGEMSEGHALFIFEVLVPKTTDLGRLRRELVHETQKLNLNASIQHRDIFEAVNRVSSF